MIDDLVNIAIDKDTFRKMSKIADKKQGNTVDEISAAFKGHIDREDEKDRQLREGKQLLTEG